MNNEQKISAAWADPEFARAAANALMDEVEQLRTRLAALEAALRTTRDHLDGDRTDLAHGTIADALYGGTAALDAALASERAAIRARVEALDRGVGVVIGGEYRVVVVATDVLSAIDAIGGAS